MPLTSREVDAMRDSWLARDDVYEEEEEEDEPDPTDLPGYEED